MADPTLDPATNPYAPADPTYADQTFDGPWPPEHWAEWLHPDAQDPTLAHLGGGGVDPLAAQMPEQAPVPMQPGMGIPAHTVDEAMAPEQAPATMGGVANDIAQGVMGLPDSARQWWEGATAPDAPLPPSVDGALDYFRGAANDTGGALAQTVTGLPDLTGARQDATDAAEGLRLANLDPEAYATLQAQHELARRSHANVRFMEETEKQRVQLEQNAKIRQDAAVKAQAATEQLATDAVKLANTEVDPDRWWHSRSTGQKIAGYIAAIVGGFAANNNGGRNIGLEAINREIDTDIDAQKANIANRRQGLDLRRGLIADQTGAANDAYRQVETVRIAAWENVTNQLTAEAQQYDPRGTAALRIGAAIRDVKARQGAAIAKWREDEAKRLIDVAKIQVDIDKQAEVGRHNKAAEKHDNYATYITGKDNNEKNTIAAGDLKVKEFTAQKNAEKIDADIVKLHAEGKDKEAEQLRQFGIGGSSTIAIDDQGKPVVDADGNPSIVHASLAQANGKPYLARDTAEAAKIATKVSAAEEVSDITNEILSIRRRVGGESTTFNSDDSQRLEALGARLGNLSKVGTEGMSSDSDMSNLKAAAGAKNVSSFRSVSAGLEEGLKRTAFSLNSYMRANQYTGKPIEFADRWSGGTKENSFEEEHTKGLFQKPNISQTDAEKQAEGYLVADFEKTNGHRPSGEEWTAIASAKKAAASDFREISPRQRETLRQRWTEALQTGAGHKKRAQSARQALESTVQTGGTEAIRREAQMYLDRLQANAAASSEPISDPSYQSVGGGQ